RGPRAGDVGGRADAGGGRAARAGGRSSPAPYDHGVRGGAAPRGRRHLRGRVRRARGAPAAPVRAPAADVVQEGAVVDSARGGRSRPRGACGGVPYAPTSEVE